MAVFWSSLTSCFPGMLPGKHEVKELIIIIIIIIELLIRCENTQTFFETSNFHNFHCHNPPSRTMDLGSTQPLT